MSNHINKYLISCRNFERKKKKKHAESKCICMKYIYAYRFVILLKQMLKLYQSENRVMSMIKTSKVNFAW